MKKLLSLYLAVSFWLYAQNIENMVGQKTYIGTNIKKIYAASPIVLYSLYIIDRDKIAGLNFPFSEKERKYIDEKICNLPVLGGWFGQGKIPNAEMILKVKPDIILLPAFIKHNEKKMLSMFGDAKITIFYINSTSLQEIIDSFAYLGKITGKEQRAGTLTNDAKKRLEKSQRLMKLNKKPKVYYAQGLTGLETECSNSVHSELIELAGGINVHKCEQKTRYGKERINFELLAKYDPDIILVFEKTFYDTIYQNKKWTTLKAVRNKKVHLIPSEPFNWFDRPPSFMKILGFEWLSRILHPEIIRTDIKKSAKSFYELYLGISLSDDEIARILGQ